MDVRKNDDTVVEASTTRLLSDRNDQTGTAMYEYSVWANLGEKLSLVPRDLRYSK